VERARGEKKEEKAREECRSGCEDRSWPRPERGVEPGWIIFSASYYCAKCAESVECLGERLVRFKLYALAARSAHVCILTYLSRMKAPWIGFAISNSKYLLKGCVYALFYRDKILEISTRRNTYITVCRHDVLVNANARLHANELL
ncbi:hypothetical protein DBV15_08691, partial [Temnothorax longispinosus]